MANKNLGTATAVTSMLKDNSVLVEIGGSIRRITLENLADAINETGSGTLSQVAWCVPIKQNQSSPEWGTLGNTALWEEFKRSCGCYLVNSGGKRSKLSKTNSGLFADGTTVDESKGNVMWCSPRLYYRMVDDAQAGYPLLYMSQLPIGGHYIEAQCIGKYKMYVTGGKGYSRSGYSPTGSMTITAFWNAAQQNGADWGLADYDFRRLLMMMALSEYGSPDIQSKLGYGVCGSQNLDLWATAATLKTGDMKSYGDNSGAKTISVVNGDNTGVNCSRISLFGIEDPYGWQWEMTQGIYFGASDNDAQTGTEVFIYDGNRMPSSAELTTHPSGDYRQTTRIDTEGYITKMQMGEYFDLIAQAIGGGSTSYWCDYFWRNIATGQLVAFGGRAYGGTYCGLGFVDSSHAFTLSSALCGSRLAYYGMLTDVNPSEL